jgi:hypothetical protein
MSEPRRLLTELRQDEKGRWYFPNAMGLAEITAALGGAYPRDGMQVIVTWSIEQLNGPKPVDQEGEQW